MINNNNWPALGILDLVTVQTNVSWGRAICYMHTFVFLLTVTRFGFLPYYLYSSHEFLCVGLRAYVWCTRSYIRYVSSLAQVASSIYSRGIHLLSVLICTVVAYLTFQRFRNMTSKCNRCTKSSLSRVGFFFFLMLTFQLNAPARRMHMYPIRVTQ